MTLRRSFRTSCMLVGLLVAFQSEAPAQSAGGAPEQGAVASRDARVYFYARGQGGVYFYARGQGDRLVTQRLSADPMSGPVVPNAPYSADAVTTVTQTLGDGTRIEQRTEAKFYRDASGRVRREQAVLGLGALNPSADAQPVVTFDSVPGDRNPFRLDPNTRTARRMPGLFTLPYIISSLNSSSSSSVATPLGLRGRDLAVGELYVADGRKVSLQPTRGLTRIPADVPAGSRRVEEPLAARQMEGVRVTGRRTTTTIPTGQIGNDRPIEIIDEQWESPELQVLVYSRYSDPRTGVVEYRLTNIQRAEQPASLFAVPSDYTTIESGAGGVQGGGGRRGGAPQ